MAWRFARITLITLPSCCCLALSALPIQVRQNSGKPVVSQLRAAIEAFSDCTVSRPELLRRFKDLWTRDVSLDKSEREFVASSIRTLQQMTEEDALHPKRSAANKAKDSLDSEVAELIFQLRDQTADLIVMCDGSRAFPKPSDPDVRLVQIGLPAVPQLLDALKDMRFTRGIKDEMDTNELIDRPFRVRDAALGILTEMAHIRLWANGCGLIEEAAFTIEIPPRPESMWGPTEAKARDWWANVRRVGERKMVLNQVASGDFSGEALQWMVKTYPKDAAAAISRASKATKSKFYPWVLEELVSRISLNTPNSVLRIKMRTAKNRIDRIAAARLVGMTAPNAEMGALISEWRRADRETDITDSDTSLIDLTNELVDIGRPEGIDTLANGLRTKSMDRKFFVLSRLEWEAYGWRCSWVRTSAPSSAAAWRARRRAVEALLASELTDTLSLPRQSCIGFRLVNDARLCDMAAFLMAENWPDKYQFDLGATPAERNRQIAECRKAWHSL